MIGMNEVFGDEYLMKRMLIVRKLTEDWSTSAWRLVGDEEGLGQRDARLNTS